MSNAIGQGHEDKMRDINRLLRGQPVEFAMRWCTADGGCACLGCASMSAGLLIAGFTKADWEAWKAWKLGGQK